MPDRASVALRYPEKAAVKKVVSKKASDNDDEALSCFLKNLLTEL